MQSITKDSEKICWGRLDYLNMQTIQKNMNNKAYEHITGYDKYMNDLELVIKQYKETMGLGPKVKFTVNPEKITRIVFSRYSLKEIFATLKIDYGMIYLYQ